MEKIINAFRSLAVGYGFRTAAIVVATIALVNIVKRPIVKRAERLAAAIGTDKSIITKHITILPVVVAFLLDLAVRLVENGFAASALDFGEIVTTAVMNGALAVATYEIVKKQLEAYAAAKSLKSVAPTDNPSASPSASPIATPTENSPALAEEPSPETIAAVLDLIGALAPTQSDEPCALAPTQSDDPENGNTPSPETPDSEMPF